jgi:hypothetical protein
MATPTTPKPTGMEDMEEIPRQLLLRVQILDRTTGKLDAKEQQQTTLCVLSDRKWHFMVVQRQHHYYFRLKFSGI